MLRYIGKRDTRKTTHLLELAIDEAKNAEDTTVVVVSPTFKMSEHALDMAREMTKGILMKNIQFMTFRDYIFYKYVFKTDHDKTSVYVDELSLCLNDLDVVAFTDFYPSKEGNNE